METDVAELSVEQLKRECEALRRENRAAMLTVDKLLKDLNKKREEIAHLQSLVASAVPVIQAPKPAAAPEMSPEESIAEIQLNKLHQAAKTRSLTLEEVRTYDLLVKNKRLAQEKSTQNVSQGSFRDVSDIELAKIAGKIDEPS